MKTQVCLLSGEVMPNVIGVLQTGATRVLPVVTADSEGQTEAFSEALSAARSPALLLEPVQVLPHDLADCLETLRSAIAGVRQGTVEINWTGGTKVMSYAARRLAEELRLPALYVNTAQRQVLLEDLATGTVRTEVIDSARLGLNVLTHIVAAGHRVEGAASLEAFRWRCTPAPALVRAATLIVDARPSEHRDLLNLAEAFTKPCTPTRLDESFLRTLREARLIQPARRPGEFLLSWETLLHPFHRQTAQHQNAAFLKSLYLEVFIWSQIKERAGVDDVAWHVVLNPTEKGRVAELDVVVSGEGRLLVIECKNHLDLDQLPDVIEEQYARTRRIGRLFGRWMLYVHRHRADYPAPNAAAIIESQEAKARDYGGRLLWHDDLAELPRTVSAFLQEPTTPL